ncbi:MAG: bifunctional nuclease family protein [Chlorobi bacterium]|nr:bifunctional nuclease family protein [Chlorobiota bacterium]
MIDSFDSFLTEVYINDLKDGTFYAKLIFEDRDIEIDTRPSDAVAIAVRCNAPIYVNEDILLETGLTAQTDNSELSDEENLKFATDDVFKKESGSNKPKTKIEQLQARLDKAIKAEDYEKAASLRDEIKNILKST